MPKLLPLGLPAEILVDVDIAALTSKFRWNNDGKGYFRRALWVDGQRKWSYLHREVAGAGDSDIVDHINGNIQDNRRLNLRCGNRVMNGQNRTKLSKQNLSGVRGVSFRNGVWVARVRVNQKDFWIGSYPTRHEAADAARAFRKKHMVYSMELTP